MNTEQILTGQDARQKMQEGIDMLANAVKSTLGPKGTTVVFRDAFENITVTKDGVSVAKQINPKDPIQRIASDLVKNVSMKANDLAGDGTTTATVLAQAIYTAGRKLIDNGAVPNEFKKGLDDATKAILDHIESKSIKIEADSPEIKQIAYIASNGSEEVATLIADIYKDLGKNVVISATEGSSVDTKVRKVKGMQFDRGYISPYCITDIDKMRADFEKPLVLLYDGKLTGLNNILPLLERASSQSKPIIIIAEDIEGDALVNLFSNHKQGVLQSCAIKSPGFGDRRRELMQDMAVMLGATIMAENVDPETVDLGTCEKAEVTATDFTLVGGKGDDAEIAERVKSLEEKIALNDVDTYEQEKLEERLAKLTSGVALVEIGSKSKTEAKELLDRVIDAKFSARAAVEEGVVSGGGIALLEAANSLPLPPESTKSYIQGYECMLESIKVPFKQILINAGLSPELIEANLTGSKRGYDIINNKYVKDMSSIGVIDPVKVTRIALESSSSIVGTLLTTNTMIVNAKMMD